MVRAKAKAKDADEPAAKEERYGHDYDHGGRWLGYPPSRPPVAAHAYVVGHYRFERVEDELAAYAELVGEMGY